MIEKHHKESKFLSLVLRHHPEAIGISLDTQGWAEVNMLIKNMKRKFPVFSLKILEEIVATDSKQRYAFSEDNTKIRANQGHSLAVALELQPQTPPRMFVPRHCQQVCREHSQKRTPKANPPTRTPQHRYSNRNQSRCATRQACHF